MFVFWEILRTNQINDPKSEANLRFSNILITFFAKIVHGFLTFSGDIEMKYSAKMG